MEADKLSLKTSEEPVTWGWSRIWTGIFYTKYEVQDIGGVAEDGYALASYVCINFSFATVDVKGSSTKVGLTFMEGCGYTLELARNKNLKVELPEVLCLESKPTTDKNTVLETALSE